MSEATLTANVLRVQLRQFARKGVDLDRLLERHPLDLGSSDTAPTEIRLCDMHEVYTSAQDLSQDGLLGLHAYQKIDFEDYGLIGSVLTFAPTVREALRSIALFNSVHENCAETTFAVFNGFSCITQRKTDSSALVHPVLNQMAVTSVIALVQQAAGKSWHPRAVCFTNETPANVEGYRETLHCPVYFGQHANMVILDNDVLEMQLPRANQHRFEIASMELRRIQASQGCRGDLILDLARVIHASMATGAPGAPELAEIIGVSLRTLQRQLALDKLTIKCLADTCRYRFAVHLLLNTDETVSRISEHLGYSELSAFERAFRRWSSMTPTKFRGIGA